MAAPDAKGQRKKALASKMAERNAANRAASTTNRSSSGGRRGKKLAFDPKKVDQAPTAFLADIVERRLTGWRQALAVLEKRGWIALEY